MHEEFKAGVRRILRARKNKKMIDAATTKKILDLAEKIMGDTSEGDPIAYFIITEITADLSRDWTMEDIACEMQRRGWMPHYVIEKGEKSAEQGWPRRN